MWEGPALGCQPSASPLETMTSKNPVCQQNTMFSAHWIQDERPFKSPQYRPNYLSSRSPAAGGLVVTSRSAGLKERKGDSYMRKQTWGLKFLNTLSTAEGGQHKGPKAQGRVLTPYGRGQT